MPDSWAPIEALVRDRAFTVEYADARARWRDGVLSVFPPGTYWLQRFASVQVLETWRLTILIDDRESQ